VVFSIGGGFKELENMNYSSINQIESNLEKGMKHKMNACHPTIGISPKETRRGGEPVPPLSL
jgi:hypothetical protein